MCELVLGVCEQDLLCKCKCVCVKLCNPPRFLSVYLSECVFS